MMQDINLETAINILLSKVNTIDESESVSLFDAVGRVCAEDVRAKFDNPPFDRSPLDGYAFAATLSKGATKEKPAKLIIVGEECAGDFFADSLKPNEALRIMTGAAIPKGADCVIRQEDVTIDGENLFVPYELKTHDNYCFAGEDIKANSLLIAKNQTLNAAHIAVLASQGFITVNVKRNPKIAIASTGDELIMPGNELTAGKIYNSNLYLIASRLNELGFDAKITGILSDNVSGVAKVIDGYKNYDLFITTGGVSVGKKDIMHDVVDKIGKKLFWRVLMKPGAPMIGYTVDKMLGVALSGNPFAAYSTFEMLVRPVLTKLSGRNVNYKRTTGILNNDFNKVSKGRRFIRAYYDDGAVTLPEQHAAGSLYSAVNCNALVDIAAGTGKLTVGTKVDVVLL